MSIERFDLIVRNGRVVLENEVVSKTLGICNGIVASIFDEDACGNTNLSETVVDARGCYVLPGAIDTHTHVFEPGADYREDFETGTKAAASGGYTCIMEMPNSNPAATSVDHFLYKKSLAEKKAVVDYAIWAGAVANNLGKLKDLKEIGCVAFKGFTLEAGPTFPFLNAANQYEAMKEVAGLNRVLGFHAEDDTIIQTLKEKYSNKKWTLELHEKARPYHAELNAINQIILFSSLTNCPVHICHLSIPEGAHMIGEAKKRGVDITVESCPHYFILDYESCSQYGTYALIQPPLRDAERKEQMWKYLLDGTIDYMGTDHAPYAQIDKEPCDGNDWGVIGGAPSIDVALPLMYDEAVLKRGMDPVAFAKAFSTNAAKRFGLYPKKGAIQVGADADLTILDPNNSWIVDRTDSFSKTKVTKFPYQNREIHSKVISTIVRGKLVYHNGNILVNPGYGKMVSPE